MNEMKGIMIVFLLFFSVLFGWIAAHNAGLVDERDERIVKQAEIIEAYGELDNVQSEIIDKLEDIIIQSQSVCIE